jgi:hypothetical protein
MFLVEFTQKITKEDLNIKRDHEIISLLLHRNVLEDSRGHHTEVGHETQPGGAAWPYPQAARPAIVGNAHELLESSFTAS